MAQDDRHPAELRAHHVEQHQQGESRDNAWQNQRQQHQSSKQRLARKSCPIKGQCRRYSEGQRDHHRGKCYLQAVEHRIPEGTIGKQHSIPVERQPMRRKSSNSLSLERIENKNHNRQVEKCKYSNGVDQQPARAWNRRRAVAHEKLHRFSSRSEKNNRLTTNTSMHSEIAAPKGQL